MAFTFIVKNSNVSGKQPLPSALEPGELAINLVDQKLYSKDTSDVIFEIGKQGDVPTGGTPERPSVDNNLGDLFFDTDLEVLLYWNGTEWVPVGQEAIALEDLTDVDFPSGPDDGDVLYFNGAEGQWEAIDPAAIAIDVDLDYTPNGDLAGTVTNTAGDDATIPIATDTVAGLFTGAEKQKLDGIEAGSTVPNDGTLTIKDSAGASLGTFTADQAGPSDITLPAAPTVGDGAIQVNGGDGITASGTNATANQSGTTTRTLAVDTTWLGSWLDTNKPIGNAKIIIKQDGSEKGSFTTNQSGSDVTINLDAGSSGGGFTQDQADALYVSLTKSEGIDGEKTFSQITRVNNKLRAGGTASDQYLEMFVEDQGGSGRFKVLQGNGDGPTALRDSTEWASITLRNSGGPGGHVVFEPKANKVECVGVGLNAQITKNGPRDTQDINNYRCQSISFQFNSERGSKSLDYVTMLYLNGNNAYNNGNGFSTALTHGIYLPDLQGKNGHLGKCYGFMSKLNKGGGWWMRHEGTAPFGSSSGEANFLYIAGYQASVGGSKKKLVVNDQGWVGGDNLREADLVKNEAIAESVLTAFTGSVDVAPRLVDMPPLDLDTENDLYDKPLSTDAYAPSSEQIRLLPEKVAAIHPLLATYTWETKEILIKEADLVTGELEQTQQVFDYNQAPTATGVDYDAVTTLLVGVVKRLRSELDEARNRIAALEAGEVSDDATDAALLTLVADLANRVSTLEGS